MLSILMIPTWVPLRWFTSNLGMSFHLWYFYQDFMDWAVSATKDRVGKKVWSFDDTNLSAWEGLVLRRFGLLMIPTWIWVPLRYFTSNFMIFGYIWWYLMIFWWYQPDSECPLRWFTSNLGLSFHGPLWLQIDLIQYDFELLRTNFVKLSYFQRGKQLG